MTGKATVKTSDTINSESVLSTKILVLDDEEIIRDVIGAMLQKMGYNNISYAVEGQETIDKYQKTYEKGTAYDVVITDLTIPGGMGGLEAAQAILKIDPQAKIIVSSGYATDSVMANYQEYGFQARAVKPYSFADLQNVMQQILTK